jgi:hypothetical protein
MGQVPFPECFKVVRHVLPINMMRTGQRYWINEELWGESRMPNFFVFAHLITLPLFFLTGGPGFPIFVFIGGEWEEDCTTLTPSGVRNSFFSFVEDLLQDNRLFISCISTI